MHFHLSCSSPTAPQHGRELVRVTSCMSRKHKRQYEAQQRSTRAAHSPLGSTGPMLPHTTHPKNLKEHEAKRTRASHACGLLMLDGTRCPSKAKPNFAVPHRSASGSSPATGNAIAGDTRSTSPHNKPTTGSPAACGWLTLRGPLRLPLLGLRPPWSCDKWINGLTVRAIAPNQAHAGDTNRCRRSGQKNSAHRCCAGFVALI